MAIYDCASGGVREETQEELSAIEVLRAGIVPAFVHRRQLRTGLHFAGQLAAVEAFVEAPETDISLKIAWTDTTYFERGHPLIIGLAAALFGWGAAELDDFFRFADTLP